MTVSTNSVPTPTKPKTKTNRTIQKTHSTYTGRAEIAEAINLLKPYLSPKTIDYLKHFLHTAGTGATQARVTTICAKSKVSTGCYSKTVKPEIEGVFDEPLIITIDTPKKDKLGRKNPNGSKFKTLQPLWKIQKLIEMKQEKDMKEHEEYMAQFVQSDITGDITGDITPNVETPCGSKVEQPFSNQQNSSFRENLLYKHKDIPIPISSVSTNIDRDSQKVEKVEGKDNFHLISNDLYLSKIIPDSIRYYLKHHLEELAAINFNILDYERFIVESPLIDLTADNDDFNVLNEFNLNKVTRDLIKDVDCKIKSTFGIMDNWCKRHLKTRQDNMPDNAPVFDSGSYSKAHDVISYNFLEDGQDQELYASSDRNFEPEEYEYDEEDLPIMKNRDTRWIQEPKPLKEECSQEIGPHDYDEDGKPLYSHYIINQFGNRVGVCHDGTPMPF